MEPRTTTSKEQLLRALGYPIPERKNTSEKEKGGSALSFPADAISQGMAAFLQYAGVAPTAATRLAAIYGSRGTELIDIFIDDAKKIYSHVASHEMSPAVYFRAQTKIRECMDSWFTEETRLVALRLMAEGFSGDAVKNMIIGFRENEQNGIPVSRLWQKYKDAPYSLVFFKNVRFDQVDKVILSSRPGLRFSPDRTMAVVGYVMETYCDNQNHTCVSLNDIIKVIGNKEEREDIYKRIKHVQHLPNENMIKSAAIWYVSDKGPQDKALVVTGNIGDGTALVSWADEYRMETEIADFVASRSAMPRSACAKGTKFDGLSDEQSAAVKAAVENSILLFTGGPGTGKTYTQKKMLEALKHNGFKKIVLCAPTGKASKRQAESTGHPSSTIHSWLLSEKKEGADAVVIDEASMIDQELFHQICGRLQENTKLILVGDDGQLDPVKRGRPFYDMLRSGVVPHASLTKTFRQGEDSAIIPVARKIREGINLTESDFQASDIDLVEPGNVCETVIATVDEYVKKGSQLDDILVLSAYNRNEYGTVNLNRILQQYFNPHGKDEPCLMIGDPKKENANNVYVGDKVIQTVNDKPRDVFNGMIGYVTAVTKQGLTVRFDNGREVTYDQKQAESLDLAYCITVHKSQGSDSKVVIMPICGEGNKFLNRSLLYTGVTRAKEHLSLVSTLETLNSVKAAKPFRKTRLAGMIKSRVAKLQKVEQEESNVKSRKK